MKALKTIKVGRKKISVYHENFEYYQPNDHVCGDCAIRAVTKALGGIKWEDALTGLYNVAMKIKEAPTSRETIGQLMKEQGWIWVGIKPNRGEKRPKVHEFAKNYKFGKYILDLSGHVVAAADGKYYDIWDCGDKSLYGYWAER